MIIIKNIDDNKLLIEFDESIIKDIDLFLTTILWEYSYLKDKYSTKFDSELIKWIKGEINDFDPFEFKDNNIFMLAAKEGGKYLNVPNINEKLNFNSMIGGYYVERIHWRLLNLGSKSHLINFNDHIIGYNYNYSYNIDNLIINMSGNFSICSTNKSNYDSDNIKHKETISILNNVHCTLCDIICTKYHHTELDINPETKIIYVLPNDRIKLISPIYCSSKGSSSLERHYFDQMTLGLECKVNNPEEMLCRSPDLYKSRLNAVDSAIACSRYLIYNNKVINTRTALELGLALKYGLEIIKYDVDSNKFMLMNKSSYVIPELSDNDLLDLDDISTAVLLGYYYGTDINLNYTNLNNKYLSLLNFNEVNKVDYNYVDSNNKIVEYNKLINNIKINL